MRCTGLAAGLLVASCGGASRTTAPAPIQNLGSAHTGAENECRIVREPGAADDPDGVEHAVPTLELRVAAVGQPLACDGPEPAGIHGHVVDAITDDPVPGVTLVSAGDGNPQQLQLTDEHGCYFIPTAPGRVRVDFYFAEGRGSIEVDVVRGRLVTVDGAVGPPR